jgi:hypothetical protein
MMRKKVWQKKIVHGDGDKKNSIFSDPHSWFQNITSMFKISFYLYLLSLWFNSPLFPVISSKILAPSKLFPPILGFTESRYAPSTFGSRSDVFVPSRWSTFTSTELLSLTNVSQHNLEPDVFARAGSANKMTHLVKSHSSKDEFVKSE